MSIQQEPVGDTAREMAEERNAKLRCPHPEWAVDTDPHAIGGERTWCNACENYIDNV